MMIGADAFQDFLLSDEEMSKSSVSNAVNLLRFRAHNERLAVVVDADAAVDRLYGGHFSDWVCGGQWNHMVDYLANLTASLAANNVHLAFAFDGALQPERFCGEWRRKQSDVRDRANLVLRHVHNKVSTVQSAPDNMIPFSGLNPALNCFHLFCLDELEIQ